MKSINHSKIISRNQKLKVEVCLFSKKEKLSTVWGTAVDIFMHHSQNPKKFKCRYSSQKILLLSKKCIIQIFPLFSVKPPAANPSHVPVSIRLVLLSREGWVYCCDFFTCHSSWLPNPFLPYRVSETKKWHFKSKNWVWYTLYFGHNSKPNVAYLSVKLRGYLDSN